ncbi:MAG TPA: adenylyltransferase/cytidyltransferase family protein [Verrucomicrobiae bacterium]|nr:adenylyltransferase/cytidyltransferase family protein [Verrucomicrobiae bacterium]
MKPTCVIGDFDNIRAPSVRFLQEAARLGPLQVYLWDDAAVREKKGAPPKFPLIERRYLLESLRFVERVTPVPVELTRGLPPCADATARWVYEPGTITPGMRAESEARGVECVEIPESALSGFPDPIGPSPPPKAKRVMVTGCYDWFHSGHVRFFEEVSGLGDLYVVVGHDANIRLLKGEGHPMFPEQERRYLAACVRHVREAMISSGDGWLDAEPEIARIRPHIYAVNGDGDRPEKRAFCEANGIEYVVLEREPAAGLPRRQSTDLRGF